MYVSLDVTTKTEEYYEVSFRCTNSTKVTVHLSNILNIDGAQYTPTTFVHFANVIDKFVCSQQAETPHVVIRCL